MPAQVGADLSGEFLVVGEDLFPNVDQADV
jgi:hypothetical protein